jgi:hypothetical protein
LILGILIYGNSAGQNPFDRSTYLTPHIPIYNLYAQIALIFLVLVPISALIGGLIGGYFLAPTLLFIHKNIFGRKMLYGIQDRPQPQTFNKLSRLYFPTLLAINIDSILLVSAPWILDLFILKADLKVDIYIRGFIVLLMFTIGVGTLVFSPIWFLTDAGIVYSNIEKVLGTDQPVEDRTVGGRVTDFLRGYAGIGTIVPYLTLLSVFFSEYQFAVTTIIVNPIGAIATYVFFFGLPIFVAITAIPSLIILDLIKGHRIRFMRGFAEKIGITDFIEISFKKINR